MDWAYFSLSGDRDDDPRLKTVTSSSTGTKTTIRITLETDDLTDANFALRSLAAIQQAQVERAKAAKAKSKAKPKKRLALPAPRLALPAPEDDG